MKICLCQINSLIGDIDGNKEKIIFNYRKAVEYGAELAVFPELCLPGYPPLDFVEKQEFRDRLKSAVLEIASVTGDTGIIFGSITENRSMIGCDIYNSAILACCGEVKFTQNKMLLPNYDVFDEARYFECAKSNPVFEFRGMRLGISICEDIWNDPEYWKRRRYEANPVRNLVESGAQILINISASPYSYGRRSERKLMLSSLSREYGLPLVYACAAGAQTDLIFDGSSMCFSSSGELLKLGRAYAEDLVLFDTDEISPEIPDDCVESEFSEEIYKALIFGIKEYMAKTGFRQVLLGLSGGIDSAIVALLATRAIGAENVHTYFMPSKYSSKGSIDDSVKLVKKLGISSGVIEIQPLVDEANRTLKPHFQGFSADVTEENLQSRIRGLCLMALSNKFNYLLLTTGNKSEMAVGYATLYGDMNGALAVIADLYKTDVYRLAEYINREGEIIPYEIIKKAPSAELRPDQKDEDSLPPYDLLDSILRMYLEENKEFVEISRIIGDGPLVEKILRLVDLNEFKRKQAAPALRVSSKAFGYGRRFPIVQGWKR